jgi:hypothetical protein
MIFLTGDASPCTVVASMLFAVMGDVFEWTARVLFFAFGHNLEKFFSGIFSISMISGCNYPFSAKNQ